MRTNKKNIYFIGIGGIGVSALARYYLGNGYKISGSDISRSEITDSLKKIGVKIFIGHNLKNLSKNTDEVIYSPAISQTNSEIKEAKKRRIKISSYPQALGELTKTHFTIAISGTHGKSTTTSMLGLILKKAGFDPTVIVGTKVPQFENSNCRIGKSKFLVIEADEHFGSFLNYSPDIIVLTSIEKDHLDFYKNFTNLKNAFRKYIKNLKMGGVVVYNKDDIQILKLKFENLKPQLKTTHYSLWQKDTKKLKSILQVIGEHNISNSLAALTAARCLKIPDKISFKTLSEYTGSWRRFEIIQTKPFILISDYAHHPTEIKATLKGAREKFIKKKIISIFQPHQYHRTLCLFNDFVKVLRKAPVDKLIISDIYGVAGREQKVIEKKVDSEKLVKKINRQNIIYIPTFEKIINYLKKEIKRGDVVIIMGAGDIYKLNTKMTKLTKLISSLKN